MADISGAEALLEAGAAILAPVLSPAGFMYQLTRQGHGSGGDFATGQFTGGAQFVEFHVRHSLGLVTYGWDDLALSPADYLRGLGVSGTCPGYSDEPLDGFRHLALDLSGPLSGFRGGDYPRIRVRPPGGSTAARPAAAVTSVRLLRRGGPRALP